MSTPTTGYVSAEYLQRMAAIAQTIKQASHKKMSIQQGDCVLDVGCGPGIDTLALAQWVGPTGKVIGIDTDANMLSIANNKAREQGSDGIVEHQQGSADSLPFSNDYFSSCHAERLLQVLPPALAAPVVSELKRVTQPQGRVVLADTDWGSFSINSTNTQLERTLVQFFAEQLRPNGYAGRQLFGLMHNNGFSNIDIEVHPLVHNTLKAVPLEWLYKEANKKQVASQEVLEQWWQEVQQLSSEDKLFCTVNMVVVSGQA